jgi:pSer/pThr/pTyr-binding forkhead associated (FHA) protein
LSTLTEPLALIVSLAGERGGMQLPIVGPSFSIGRDVTNNLCVMDDQAVSRQHCIIHVVGASLMIEDCSRNGTFLNGERVLGMSQLPIPSTVKVGFREFAIVPNEPDEDNVTSVIDTSQMGDMGSLVVPRTATLRLTTDAYLVVDVVDSTSMVRRDDGRYFAKLTLAMGRTLERSMRNEPHPFLKSTGDGFFACFGSANSALKSALGLPPTLAQMELEARLSFALHWGPSTLADRNDRIGNNVHAVFSVEQIRHQDSVLEQEITSKTTSEPLVLMTEAFWKELDEAERALARPLGPYLVKGFDEPISIYRWYGPIA